MADSPSPQGAPEDLSNKLHELLASLWSRSQQTIGDRLDVLRACHHSLRENQADMQARKSGADAAHKLAGILGTFGLPEGTELARQTEVMLESGTTIHANELDSMHHAIEQLDQMIEAKSRDAGRRRA